MALLLRSRRSMNWDLNSTGRNSSDPESFEDEELFGPAFVYSVCTIYIIICVTAVIGNLMVIYAILANKSLRTSPTNQFLLSLAISDLITAILAMPFHIEFVFLHGVWNHGVGMCIAFLTAWLITVPTSILTLLAISIDRFLSLKDPLRRYRVSQTLTLIVISIIWVYCLVWAFVPLMGWQTPGENPLDDGVCSMPYTIEYLMISSFVNFVGPLLLSCVFFILAFIIACKHQRNAQILKTCGSRKHASKEDLKFFERNIKGLKTTLMFMAAFFLCWQPYRYFSIASNLYGGEHWDPYPFKAYVLLMMLGYLNTALNPFLFAFRNQRFGSTYRKLLHSLKPALNPSESHVRRPSSISTQSSISEIPETDTKEIRLQSIRNKRTTPDPPRKHSGQSSG